MFDELVAANDRYVETFHLGGLSGQAARGLAIVTCIDTRIEPLAIFGLVPGDAKIIRNAGGRATPDALRSLALATALLGVRAIVVMHHTRCALEGASEAELRATLPQTVADALPDPLLAMPDPDAALRGDVATVRAHPALPAEISVVGWRYDVDTGRVAQVVPTES
jgi:carbonic anhydrase